MKDAHMNTIGSEYFLLSVQKNAHVVSRETHEVVAELNLKSREMSCSLVFKNILMIGTYVDTLFLFSMPTFELLFSIRSHDSILSLCVISSVHNFIALGQASGYVDILKIQSNQMN